MDVNSFNVIYTPISNFFGQDSFTYQVFNGEYYSDPAFVYIDIEPVNDIPIVNSLNLNLEEDTSLDIQLSGSDIDSNSIEFQIISNPINGVANLLGDNIVYTPINNYYGSDSIQILGYDGTDYARGLEEIADAILNDRPHRASAEHAAHVIEVMEAIDTSIKSNHSIEVSSSFTQPPLMDWAS